MAEEKKSNSTELDSETVKQVEDTFLNTKSWLPDFIEPYWQELQEYPFILVIVVLAAGYILARVAKWFFVKVWGGISSKTKNNYDDQLKPLISKTVFTVVFFLSMMLAVEAAQFEVETSKLIRRLIFSVLVLSLMMTALKGSKIVLQALSNNHQHFSMIEERTMPILNIVSQILIIGAFSYFLILLWGKDPTAWLASAGVVGIAVGFAAKDTLANLFAGFFIVADSPYKLGDYIVLDSGERGMVTHVGIRSTRLLTRDDVQVTIPNSVMGNAKIVNESGGPSEKTRIRISVEVSYDSDLEQVCKLLDVIADENEQVCKTPNPRVRAKSFAASGIQIQLQLWILKPELRGRITHNLILTIHQQFKDAGIEIPYAKQDLYIKRMPDGS